MASEAADDKESVARAQLPFKAEYCKTSRAKCKKCSEPMEANSLKLANMTKSRFHDGYDATFYHVKCFFQIKRPASVAEIRHFETLKYEDQKMLEQAIETKGLTVLGTTVESPKKDTKKSDKSKGKNKKRNTDEIADAGECLVNYGDFLVEYAKSNRSKCKKCEEKIEKDSIRLGKLDYDADTPYNSGPVPRWYHVKCFAKAIEELEFFGEIDKVKDFDKLDESDQKTLKKKIKYEPKPNESPLKKIKAEEPAVDENEEKLLKKQSDKYFKLREFVNTMKRKDIELLLESMKQKSNFKAPSSLIDMATDVLMFGPLAKCPTCRNKGTIVLRGTSYICTHSSESDQLPCSYETHEPKRGTPDIPEELVEKYPFFETSYKFKGGSRVFPSKFVKAVEQKEAEDNNIVQAGAPLEGLDIGIISWNAIKTEKSKMQKKITTLGGKVVTALSSSVFVIITNKDELTKETPKVEVAKALDVPIATEDFIFKIKNKNDVVTEVEKCLIGEWKGDLKARMDKLISKNQSSQEVKLE